MIKPKAINCNYSVGRFCFAHLQNFLIGAQIRKTAKIDVIDYGTESRTSNFVEQVYRGMQSLCAKGAGSGERSARVKGQSPWQVKGGSHCPVIWRFAIWYWVLSVTGTETFGSFAAIPSGETT